MNELEAYIHEQAFAGFISYCSGEAEMVAQFESDAGVKFSLPRTPIDAMIDKSTGYNRSIVKQFVEWCADKYGRKMLPDDLDLFLKPATENESR